MRLNTAQSIIQIGTRDPVPVHLNDYPIEKSVTDIELEQLQEDAWTKLHASSNPSTSPSTETVEADQNPGSEAASRDETAEIKVSSDAVDLLRDIAGRPFTKTSDRYELFSSAGTGNRIKNELVDAGLVRERWVRDRSKFKLLELTDDGRSFLEDRGVTVDRKGRGRIVHRYWQHRLRDLFTDMGYEAGIEVKNADVAVEANGAQLAIEVSMDGAEREVEHVPDRLEEGFDVIWFACRNGAVRKTLEGRLREKELLSERARLHLFQEFLELETLLD